LRLFVGKRVDYRLKGGKSHEDIVSLRKIKYGKKSSSRSTSFCGTEGSEDTVVLIETNIDDMNPQIYEYVMERLFQYGALDVFLTQIIMKKSRPGIKLSVLCGEDKKDGLMKIILEETTSIGVRFYEAQRKMLRRTIESIDTKFGKIRVKVSRYGDRILKITPEYEDCKKIAKQRAIPLKEVIKKVGLSLKH
ncbi:MAG: LarC family nickel insertion protein, partial [Thermodesulfovibrionia bacterium]|nr:LarC family nickel insertion protein [Thermodesulfovibrionia bacterium]